jgi:hypothetical protein
MESAKDSWNGQIEELVRKAQNTDWTLVRERAERAARDAFAGISGGAKEAEGAVEGIARKREG